MLSCKRDVGAAIKKKLAERDGWRIVTLDEIYTS